MIKKRFFSKSLLIWTTAASVVLFVILQFIVVGSTHLENKNLIDNRKSQEDAFARLPAEQKTIINAEKYLIDNLGMVATEQRLILDYLQRKFDLNMKLSVNISPITTRTSADNYPLEIHFVERIAYPDKLVTAKPRNVLDPMSWVTVYSANCDHTPLPKDFWTRVKQNYSHGGYEMTHIVLALSFMKDNGCTIPEEAEEIEREVIAAMARLADDPGTNADLRYESIAFMMLAGSYDTVKREWIEKVLSEQRPDGSWSFTLNDGRSNDHATTLALWAILEYKDPNRPYEPFIRRPS